MEHIETIILNGISQTDYYNLLDYINSNKEYLEIKNSDEMKSYHSCCGHSF